MNRLAAIADGLIAAGLAAMWFATILLARQDYPVVAAAPLVLASLLVAIWRPGAKSLGTIAVTLVLAALVGILVVATGRHANVGPALDAGWHHARAEAAR